MEGTQGQAPSAFALNGQMSGIRERREAVVRDSAALDKLWREHTRGSGAPAPMIDFAKQSLVAVFAGSKPTGGYAVEVGKVDRAGGKATVHATVLKPAPGMMTTQAFTYPFAMLAVPKLPATVKFDVTEKVRG